MTKPGGDPAPADPRRMTDLDPAELAVDRLLAAVPPVPPPLGFRDAVMRRIAGEPRSLLEWAVAAALALPSLAFLLWELAVEGVDLELALANVLTFAAGAQEQTFFSVDGLLVFAFALLGLGGLVGSHALLAPGGRAR